MEQSHTEQYFDQGDTLKGNGVLLECTFVSYQERTLENGEVQRYNFTYSFRPQEDMERERRETTPPEAAPQEPTEGEEQPNTEEQEA